MAADSATVHRVACKSLTDVTSEHNVVVKQYDAAATATTQQQFPVLLVHALTRQSGDFEALLTALREAGFTVATWDVVGRGESDYAVNAADYGYPQYAADAVTVLDYLGWEKAHWVGTSMGGLIALTMGATPGNENRLLGLVLNDVGPHVPADTLRHIVSYAGKEKVFITKDIAMEFLKNTYKEFKPMSDACWSSMLEASIEPAAAWLAVREGRDPTAADPRPGAQVRAEAAVWTATGPADVQDVPPGAEVAGACRLRYDARIGEAFPPPEAITADVELWPAWAMLHAQDMLVLHGAHSGVLTLDAAQRMVLPKESPHIRGRRHLLDVQLPGCGHVPSLRDDFQTQAVVSFLQLSDKDAAKQ